MAPDLMGSSSIQPASVIIRRAHISDSSRLSRLARAAKAHWGYPAAWLDEWREVLTITPESIQTTVVFKGVVEGEVVGFYALSPEADGVQLDHLWVAPAVIGRGVGRLLFQHTVNTARQLGAARILIESDPNAADFYRHMGCTCIGERRGTVAGMPRVLPLFELVISSALSADS